MSKRKHKEKEAKKRDEASKHPAATVAVVAHSGKTFGGGLPELRRVLAEAGHDDPLWYEVPKSSKAPRAIHRALKKGADLVFVWGGDGMVQRCIDALAKSEAELAIIPAGTANLLATNLGIPRDIARAVSAGLEGPRRSLDVGIMNKERFAVMAGTGFDALIMREAGGAAKRRMGRLAYIGGGIKALQARSVRMKIRIDGKVWWRGKGSCFLAGNVGTITGGLRVFPEASPEDGMLEVGVVTAKSAWQWLQVLSRVVRGKVEGSPLMKTGRGKKITVSLGRKMPYELDGGARDPVRKLEIRAVSGGVTVCVPPAAAVTGATPRRRAAPKPAPTRPPAPARASSPEAQPPKPPASPSSGSAATGAPPPAAH
ncbi:MAG: diacylglycerol kinase family protein [Myxococcales bacterium]